MGVDGKKWMAVLVVVLELSIIYGVKEQIQQVPCFFIFGDSLVDNGNNNNILSLAKANYWPFGIDFPMGATGRFCNGKVIVDVIAEKLGFKDYIPPLAIAEGENVLKGVNYASGGAGIRSETGQQLGVRISLSEQIHNHKNTVLKVREILGDNKTASNYLKKCIYWVGFGANDYLNNYFKPALYSTSRLYSPKMYSDLLIQQYSKKLKVLYDYGARKLALAAVGTLGCIPNFLALNSTDGSSCVQTVNKAVKMFNTKLKALVDDFNTNLTDAKFTYNDLYGILEEVIGNPTTFGFKIANEGCCGLGRNRGELSCVLWQSPCENRNKYVFWDAFHPTEAFNIIGGRRVYSAESPSDAYPFDISHLAQLQI